MSVKTEIDRIKANISSSYTNLAALGATMPPVLNSENLPDTINSISGGQFNTRWRITYDDGTQEVIDLITRAVEEE